MQTGLPGEIGLREAERVCRSDPSEVDCLIVHLVRVLRAVFSSLFRCSFLKEKPAYSEALSCLLMRNMTSAIPILVSQR